METLILYLFLTLLATMWIAIMVTIYKDEKDAKTNNNNSKRD